MPDVVTLSRFRADMSRSLSRRGKKLLEAADLPAEVAKLEPLDAYFIIKELGVDSATPLLMHLSSEQLQACVDLDCWEGDTMSPEEMDAWLAPFSAQGTQELAEAFILLDEQVQVVFLNRSLVVYDAEEGEALGEPRKGVSRKTTPDAFFVLETLPEQEREVEPLVLVDALYRLDMNDAFRLLTAAKWELPSPMEEDAFRFRTGRMQDLGFPARQDAIKLFAAPNKNKPQVRPVETNLSLRGSAALPALYAQPLTVESLLTRALGQLTDEAQIDSLEVSLRHLINSAVVAYGASPKNIQNTFHIAERVRDVVSLGMEHLLSPDQPHPDAAQETASNDAAQLLNDWSLFELFRQGHGLIRELSDRARELSADPIVRHWLDRDESQDAATSQQRLDRAFLLNLCAVPPLHGGYDPATPASVRAFASKQELLKAKERLETLIAQVA